MCELFGYTAKTEYNINSYLKDFFKRSIGHPNGWGLASMDGNEIAVEKEPIQATKSFYLKERLSIPIKGNNVFGHIRMATIGNVEYINCHPYSYKDDNGRRWTLIHNGTIFDYQPLSKYIYSQEGTTDSERILLYIIDQVNQKEKAGVLSDEERFNLVNSILSEMAAGNKLNVMLFDGEFMYVHTNYKNSLYYLEKHDGTMFSTYPLSDEDWKKIPFTRLLVYKEGQLVYEGANHGNEYIDNEEDMKYIYQNYAGL